MAWQVLDNTVKNNMLTQVNNGLGTAAKISWQTSGGSELAETALNASGNPFGSPSGGSMSLTGVPLTSDVLSGSGLARCQFQTSADAAILQGTVGTSGSDINFDVLPTTGQQGRIDSLSLGIT
jgi:hypothetical protein